VKLKQWFFTEKKLGLLLHNSDEQKDFGRDAVRQG